MTDDQLQPKPTEGSASENPEGDKEFATYYALAIAVGLPLGMGFGLLVFDNTALGMLMGLALAPVIALLMKRANSEESSPEDASPE